MRIVLIFLLLTFVSCSAPSNIKIGMLLNLSGANAAVGVAARDVAILEIEKWNLEGGINGRKVIYEVYDHNSDPELAKELTLKLCESEIDLIYGPALSSVVRDVVEVANEYNVPVISPSASLEELKDINDVFIRTVGMASDQGILIKEELQKKGMSKPLIFYDPGNLSYSSSITRVLTDAFSEAIVDSVTVDTVLEKILLHQNSPIDSIVIITSSTTAALIAQHTVDKISSDILLIGSSWTMTGSLTALGGHAVEGMILVSSMEKAIEGKKLDFFNEYREKYLIAPTLVHQLSYDCMQILKDGLLNISDQEITSTGLIQIFVDHSPYVGLNENISINNFGDAERSMLVLIVEKGHIKRLYD